MTRRYALTSALVALCSTSALSPQITSAIGEDEVGINQAVLDANNDWMIALVASHPDDRYVLPAAYWRFLHGYRIAVILFTRGEGGQNSTGPEVGDELGMLRTLETEDCAQRLGFSVYYLNRPDAGYCRTGAEALELWGKESTTAALARVLRKIRPDIVAPTHDPTEPHGPDQGLLAILPRAVELSADAAFTGSEPAIPLPRVFRGGRPDDDSPAERQLALSLTKKDPIRRRTFQDLAYEALVSAHVSAHPFRPMKEMFRDELPLVGLLPGSREVRQVHEGLPNLYSELRRVWPESEVDAFREDLEGSRTRRGLRGLFGIPSQLAERALDLRARLAEALEDAPAELAGDLALRAERRIEALDRVAIYAMGLSASVSVAADTYAVRGEELAVEFELLNGNNDLTDLRVEVVGTGQVLLPAGDADRVVLGRQEALRQQLSVRVPELRADHRERLARLFRSNTFRYPIELELSFSACCGEHVQPLRFRLSVTAELRPPVELEVRPRMLLVPNGTTEVPFSVRVRHYSQRPIEGRLRVKPPANFVARPPSARVEMSAERTRDFLFKLRVPRRDTRAPILLELGDAETRVSIRGVDGLTVQPRNLRVGLIRGVDDTAGAVLRGLGATVVELGETVLATRDLDDLDTIVVDIRALSHRETASANYSRLIQFAEDGGRLVVFYHKDSEFNLSDGSAREHPPGLELFIGRGRVTEEDAPVEILAKDHELLAWPNRLQADDWDGWIQERGLYFAQRWGRGFEEILQLNDPGQPPERGALLYGRAGRGEIIYCALALYRQLKKLHPGACRLFANLVSRPQ